MVPIDMLPMSTGESARPAPTPSMLASVIRLMAAARSPGANQLAATLVQAFNRKGWATVMPMVLHRTRL